MIGTHYYIANHGSDLTNIGTPYAVDYVADVSHPTETAVEIAVSKYTLGPVADNDYTTGTPVPVRSGITKIYVLDELVIPVNGVPGAIGIVALGTVDLAGTPADGLFITSPVVSLGTSAVITSSADRGVELTVDAGAAALPVVRVKDGKPIAINGGKTSLTITRVEGVEPLLINSADYTAVTVESGTGNITFTKGQTPTPTPGVFGIASTGTTVFNDVVVLQATSKIAGDVVFSKGVTVLPGTGGTNSVTFSGNVTLWHNTTSATNSPLLTFGTGSGAGDDGRILAAGKTISVGGESYTTSTGSGVVPVTPILTVVEKATITADAANAMFTSDQTKFDEKSPEAAKKLTLSGQGITIVSGKLEVANGATLVLGKKITTNVPVSPDNTRAKSGYLGVAEGGTISFSGTAGAIDIKNNEAAPAVSGTIAYTSTTGSASLKPAGGAVTFGFSEIAGEGASLNATGALAFTVGADKSFRLSGVNLNLAGTLTLTKTSGGAGVATKLVLINKGQITLDTKPGVANERTKLTNGTGEANFTGIGAVALGASNKADANLISLADGGGGTVTVTNSSSANDFAFEKSQVKLAD